MFECPAMQGVRGRYPTLFSPAKNTMQLLMWQGGIVGLAHYIDIVRHACSKKAVMDFISLVPLT